MIHAAWILMRYKRRIKRKRVVNIRIVMMIKTVILPICRHRNFMFKRNIKEIIRQVMIALEVIKIPLTVEQSKVIRLFTLAA